MKKRLLYLIICLTVTLSCLFTGCEIVEQLLNEGITYEDEADNKKEEDSFQNNGETYPEGSALALYDWYASIPEFRGTPYIEVNGDIPFFSDFDKKRTDAFEIYSDLDCLGRCGVAYANICEEIMPTEKRDNDLSSVTPSGWHQKQYNGEMLYNRSHLIAYQLAGENANEKNLITGTRYFNAVGMTQFEHTVADYIDDNPSNHVLYRVTPIYGEATDLVARGVLMEAWSVEDNGYGCQFCVFVYNVQAGVEIDYATGYNSEIPDTSGEETHTYIINTGNMKFHTEDCPNAASITASKRRTYTGTRSRIIAQGYEPAGCCNP